MAAQSYPTVSSHVGEFNMGEWASLYSARFDDGYLAELDKYGVGSYYFDFIKFANQTTSITTRTPKIYYKLEWEATVKTAGAINTGAAGADISFTVHADDVDASGNLPVMEGEGLVIPAYYQTPGENRIYVISDITGTTVTATPLSADGNTITQSQIGTQIPASTTLKVHGFFAGYGTGQPPGHNSVRATKTFYTQIVKTSMNYEGGIQAIKWRQVKTDSGANSVWVEGQELAELYHTKRLDDTIFLGELNDNTNLTATSNFGGTSGVPATKGIWNWAVEEGQELLYPGTWEYSNLYDYKDLALSQNVASRNVSFLMGTDLQRMVELAGLDWLKEYSGGSDLFRTANEIGINIKYAMVNGFMFMFQELKSFANPLRYGGKAYEFSKYGLMIPDQMENVTVEGRTERHPNVTVGFLNWGGENRERILRVVDGMSGKLSTASNDYDGSNLYILTELAVLAFRPNQYVTVKPQ